MTAGAQSPVWDNVISDPSGKTLPASVHGPDKELAVLMSINVSVLNRK